MDQKVWPNNYLGNRSAALQNTCRNENALYNK